MLRRSALLTLAVVLLATLAFCACNHAPQGRVKIVVSIAPLYDLATRIAGPDADVVFIVPDGTDPYAFHPSAGDAAKASGAQLGVMIGLGLDPWLEDLVRNHATGKVRILKAGDRVPTVSVKTADGADADASDPHVWLDPERARLIVKQIGEELSRADVAHAAGYRSRANDVDVALDAADKRIDGEVKAWASRAIVSQRGAVTYFADRYKLDVVAVAANDAARARATDAARSRRAKVVVIEGSGDGVARSVARDAGLQVVAIDPFGRHDARYEDTLDAIVRALAPALR